MVQHLLGDIARAQDTGRLFRQVDDGGFQPYAHLPAVYDHLYPALHILRDVPGAGWTGLPGAVGAGGGDVAAAVLYEPARHGVGGKAHRHGVQSSGGLPGDCPGLGQYHGQGAGPEGVCYFDGLFR